MLERVKDIYNRWIVPGHRTGNNTHNVSCTVSVRDEEWEEVGKWMWQNREYYNGIAVLPYFGGNYKQAPFEDIDEKTFEGMFIKLKEVDLSNVVEIVDNTNLTGELACAGGSCEIT